jgi:flagellar basal body-associated protein FliL
MNAVVWIIIFVMFFFGLCSISAIVFSSIIDEEADKREMTDEQTEPADIRKFI